MIKTTLKSCLLAASVLAFLAMPVCAAQLNTQSNLVDDSGTPPEPPPSPDTAQAQFATAIEDLPLMPGLVIKPEDDVLFGSPKSGRIVNTTAEGNVDVDDVYNFYRRSLPQLGWKPMDARDYMRENEKLGIVAHADGKLTTVQFSITPLSK